MEFSDQFEMLLRFMRCQYNRNESFQLRIANLEQEVLRQRMLLINAGIEKVGTKE